jgi:hypothetical protein
MDVGIPYPVFSVFDFITAMQICQSPIVHNQHYGQLPNSPFVHYYKYFSAWMIDDFDSLYICVQQQYTDGF